MLSFVLIPITFLISVQIGLVIFETLVPEHYWCNPPGRENTSWTPEEWWNLTVPKTEDGQLEKCLQYEMQYVNNELTIYNKTKECKTWEHERSMISESFATSNGWLCQREIYSVHILSCGRAGNAIGTFILPLVADKYTGRRKMFLISCGVHLGFDLFVLITSLYTITLITRFLGGLSFQTNFQMPYVIGLELTSPDKRAVVSLAVFVSWTLGMCCTALIAWLVPHWRFQIIIACGISLFMLGYWRYLPESPRWLLSMHRLSDSAAILIKIAIRNKEKVTRAKIMEDLIALSKREEKETIKLREILKYKRFLFNVFLVICISISSFIAYGCTLFNVKIFPNNYYLSYFVLSISELPSNIMGYLSVQYLGRKFTSIQTSLFVAVLCITATFYLKDPVTLLVIVALVKLFATESMYCLYVVATEVAATPVRSTTLGFILLIGMICIAIAPYIVTVSGDGPLQYWVIAGINGTIALLSIFLPETLGLPLPQTLPESNNIGKTRPNFKWINHWNQHSYATCLTDEPPGEKDQL